MVLQTAVSLFSHRRYTRRLREHAHYELRNMCTCTHVYTKMSHIMVCIVNKRNKKQQQQSDTQNLKSSIRNITTQLPALAHIHVLCGDFATTHKSALIYQAEAHMHASWQLQPSSLPITSSWPPSLLPRTAIMSPELPRTSNWSLPLLGTAPAPPLPSAARSPPPPLPSARPKVEWIAM